LKAGLPSVEGRHSLDLCNAASGQFGRSHNAHSRVTKADAAMVRKVRFVPGVPPFPPGDFDSLALAVTPDFVIIACGLKGQP
jgi:hypothetical protein